MAIEAGKLRPSQAVTQSGPGSLIDLPTLSMIVMTADDWEISHSRRVDEPRLARHLRVATFRNPPYFDAKAGVGGIPATIFPRFLVCPRCRRLAPHSKFSFNAHRSEHICKAPACPGKGYAVAYPARFMVACAKGHLSDFPWHRYCHKPGVVCDEELRLEDSGETGAITDLWVNCPVHDEGESLGHAFGQAGRKRLPGCDAERPWLGAARGCVQQPRVLLRGASNAYFSIVESAIFIPPWSDPLQVALGPLRRAAGESRLGREDGDVGFEVNNAPTLEQLADQIWSALSRRRAARRNLSSTCARRSGGRCRRNPPRSTRRRSSTRDRCRCRRKWIDFVDRVVLLERLREVRALRGFTRIDPIPDIGDLGEVEALENGMAPIMRRRPARWYPGVEFRGEGVFIQLDEEVVRVWEDRPEVKEKASRHAEAQKRWNLAAAWPVEPPRPSRYLLLHSFAHALIRQLSLDCGYASTSLRERIYSSDDPALPQAGLLMGTATPDSDGSLGGLVEMGDAGRAWPADPTAGRTMPSPAPATRTVRARSRTGQNG